MKLELKHLAPYLPYRLKCRNLISAQDEISELKVSLESKNDTTISHLLDYDFYKTKPILRPLPDLKHKHFTDSAFGIELGIKDLDGIKLKYQECCMSDYVGGYNDLLKHHFDVFGLIDQGLAIDINTLES